MPEKFTNYMEVLVEEALEGWMRKGEPFCGCPRCRMDVMAYALNRLPAKYVVSRDGEIYTQMDGLKLQAQTDVISRVLEGIRLISVKPRHS